MTGLYRATAGQGVITADNLNGVNQTCDNASQLRTLTGVTGMQVYIRGTTTIADGGQGNFYWNASSTAADDNGVTTIKPTGASSGAWTRLPVPLTGWPLLVPSGSNDTAAIAAALAKGPVILAGGNFIITGALTCGNYVYMLAGAVLTTPGLATVAFNSGFEAPIAQVFGAGVTVTFNPQFAPSPGYPEWWGAVSDSSSANCAPAINAAIISGLTSIMFQSADYWTSTTIYLSTGYVELYGTGSEWMGTTNQCTRIVAAFTPGAVLQIGPSTIPSGGVNSFQEGNYVHDIDFARSASVSAPAPGSELSGSTIGVLMQYTLGLKIANLRSTEQILGFVYNGCVGTLAQNCNAFRSFASTTPYVGAITASVSGNIMTVTATSKTLGGGTAISSGGIASNTVIIGQNSGTTGSTGAYQLNTSNGTIASTGFVSSYDPFWGHFLNGNASIGLAGGNASTYIQNCNTSTGNSPVKFAIGLYANALFEDTYIRDFETSAVAMGMLIVGASGITIGNFNLIVDHAVLDQCSISGVTIASANLTSINFTNGYIAPTSSTGTLYGITVQSCKGALTITNNEILGGSAASGYTGLYYYGSYGIQSTGNRVMDCPVPALITSCNCVRMTDLFVNWQTTSSVAAVSISGTNTSLHIDSIVQGKSSGFAYGYNVSTTTTTLSEMDMTGVASACIASGSGNKLIYNGTTITSAGSFGTNNLAQGVFA